MNQMRGVLKTLLPGLIPLFIFIIADAIWGTKVGLIVAVIVGVLELIVVYIKEKRIEKFILLDTGLLVFFGAISILLEQDIFFKLKPALIELILLVIVGISAFTRLNLFQAMGKRYLKGMNTSKVQDDQMRKMTKHLFFLLFVHIALVVYAAFYWSSAAWGFISGGLFYVMIAAYFALVLLGKRYENYKLSKEEQLPIIDKTGNIIGKAPRSLCHKGEPKILHPVVHLHVVNEKGEVFLQKRPDNKLVMPGKWDTAVGGHIAYGETIETALKRETLEEIGLSDFKAKLIHRYEWNSDLESELVFVFLTNDHKGIQIPTPEVEEGRFWSIDEIEKSIGESVLTTNFEQEFDIIRKHFV